MTDALPSDAALVRYLLGSAGEDEGRFDELSVTDAAFAERLRAIEHDLADAYARNELSPSDRERWEARYLASQHGRDDLALATALARREARGARREARGARREAGAGRRKAREAWFEPAWQLSAAAVLVLAVTVGYRLIHRPPVASVAQQPPAVTTPAAPPTVAPAARVIALTLAPSVRSIAEPPTLAIPPGTTDVKLTLRLEPDSYQRYDVAVRDLTSSSVVWHVDAATASGTSAARALVVSIPASTFTTRRYLISVMGQPSATPDIVASYTVFVVLQ